MPGYEYNPLTKLDLQKKSAVSPSDIQHLEQEIASINEDITDINGDLKNKVPKFFTSIEELEIGEIGQYQGETTEEFTHGYFYQRGTGELTPTYTPSQTLQFVMKAPSNASAECYSTQMYGEMPYVDFSTSNYSMPYVSDTSPLPGCLAIFGWHYDNKEFNVVLFPLESGIKSTILIDESFDNDFFYYGSPFAPNYGYLYEYAFNTHGTLSVPVKIENNSVFFYYNNSWIEVEHPTAHGNMACRIWSSYTKIDNHYVACKIFNSALGSFVFLQNEDYAMSLRRNISIIRQDYHTWIFDEFEAVIDVVTWEYSPSSQRVDTQPAIDPSDFATAAQGTKADTALQAITHGTDGNYVTSTIGAKDANNEQSVSVSLTLQPISTAGSCAKGVAEASDVKDYIGNNTATPSQGAKADSALQQIVHGTDGSYITTTVTQKDANNEQTIYTALTLQDIETADADHKGVAEAANVRKFFNVIAAESEAYGVMWDTANPSPNLTRIGNMRNHALLPVQSAMIGGVLADDGTFTTFDNQADWTQATQARDGSDGQVMVQLPRHWRRCEKSGTYNIVMISPVEIPGYVEVRQQYVSAYEATLQHSTSKLCSVNNADADYRGGQNEASWDGTYRTLLNRPITNYNLAEFRTFARNRANNTKWNCLTYEAVRTIYWLFVTEYATLNSQADFNSALGANGFRQGGLGIGVSDWTGDAWNAYNGYAPLIPCGILDEYGSGTAVKNFSVYNADTTLAHTFSCNKYRGIEMPFAHIWKYSDGVLVNVESGDGVSTVYATTDTSYFSSSSFANYAEICNSYRVDSYIKDIVFNKEGDIFAISPNGNSTSYYCDQYWGANLPSTTELRAWRFGGSAPDGARCGLACSGSYGGVGGRDRYLGSRLCFVP